MKSPPREPSRRAALACTLGGAALLGACARGESSEEGEAVSAVEDLMREHGILRRLLVVYRETAGLLRGHGANFEAAALAQASDLFRSFG
jgi:hypothetical protein